MTKQLEIFDSGQSCSHCGKDPGYKQEISWNGFFDLDTKQYCCWPCRDLHYVKKAATEFKGLYSEMPVHLTHHLPAYQL